MEIDINRNIAIARSIKRRYLNSKSDLQELLILFESSRDENEKLGILLAITEILKHRDFCTLIDEYTKIDGSQARIVSVFTLRIQVLLKEVMDNSLLGIMLEACDNRDIRALIYYRSIELGK